MSEQEQALQAATNSPTFALLKQAGIHLGVWLLAFSLFAATDSWAQLTGWSLATLLNILTGFIAGFATVNLLHEWFHYFGAKACTARYDISRKASLLIFDWDFENNSLDQFFIMSIAGTVGGILGLLLLYAGIEANSAGRAALVAGGVTSFAFGSILEWPVLARTRRSRDPQAELMKLTPPVLGRAGMGSLIAGLTTWAILL